MTNNDNNKIYDQISSMKKIELHRHIEGCISPEYFHSLVLKHEPNSEFSDRSKIVSLYNFSSFEGFLRAYSTVVSFLRDIEDFEKLAQLVVSQLKKENVIYAELIFSPQPYLLNGLDLEKILIPLQGIFQNSGIKTSLIIDIVRNFGVERAEDFVSELDSLPPFLKQWVKAISIGGDEFNYPAKIFKKVFKKAIKSGFLTYAHAGEWGGPENIWDSIQLLNVKRIGHGIRSIEDQVLVEYLIDNQIMLDISPTSNYLTGALAKDAIHPIKFLLEKGVLVSINTDDPGFFKTNLTEEYYKVYQMGVDLNIIESIPEKIIESSMLSIDEKIDLSRNFD